MFAVAAAHATLPAKIKGAQHLDIYDVRIIQYRSTILKLSEVIRLLSVLEKSLEKRQEAGKTIIPLINYVLSLCEGPVFSVHPNLKKRFSLLSEFRLSKQTEITPQIVTSNLEYDVEFAPLIVDLQQLRENVYDANLQWKLMGCLQAISQNALDIYDKKMKQVFAERNSNRIPDLPTKVVPFDLGAIEDIVKPYEIGLCLDWAVLINDREQDTSFNSLRKLQKQVLAKFLTNVNEKTFPVLRTYFNQLQKACSARGPFTSFLKELPYWELSVHRLYAYIYRILCLLDVIIGLTRQLWLPNRDHFYSLRSQLSSENVYAYREVLDRIDSICNEPKRNVTGTVLSILDSCSKSNLNISVASNTIPDIFTNSISRVTPILKNTLQSINSWLEVWKFVDGNVDSHDKLASLNEGQLFNMLQERLAVDKLNQLEKQQTMNRLSPDVASSTTGGGLTYTGSNIRRSPSKRLSAPPSPVNSSNATSPGKVSPLMSRTNSVERSGTKNSNMSSPQLSRRGSTVGIRVSSPIAHSPSPQVSRGGSIADGRLGSSVLMKNTTDQKNAPRSPLGNKTLSGRRRSSSFQSGQNEAVKNNRQSAMPSRSNSLQAHATASQKAIQDSFGKLTRSGSTNGLPNISAGVNARKLQQTTRKTRAQTPNGNPPTSNRQGFESASETSPLPEMEELRIDSDRNNTGVEKPTAKESLDNGLSSPQKRRLQLQQQREPEKLFGSESSKQEQEQQKPLLPTDNGNSKGAKVSDVLRELPQIKEPEREEQDEKGLLSEVGDSSTELQNLQNEHSPYAGTEQTGIQETESPHAVQKRVRFAGVGPMTEDEMVRPTRRGWYKKPPVLHYPPPPPQYLGQKFRLRQEGIAFRTSLREERSQEPNSKRNSLVTSFDELAPPPKESMSHRFASKLREKLK